MKLLKKLFWLGLILFLLHLAVIVIFGWTAKPKKSDLILVLGNKVELNGSPSKRLQVRLNKGVELFNDGMAEKIIVSGGVGKEGFDEAEVMAAYLVEKGIPETHIILDNQGVTTFASAVNAKRILQDENAKSIIIVSQYFHLLRSKIAFKKAGIPYISLKAADWFFEWRDFYSLPREIIGIYYYVTRSYG